ncbi:TPA: metal-dependent hydrolase [Candidatus Woesearchaeota archaeon]|nr:metal-dependent hydrolase [Candidatus Woesearchaeota archaeon]HII65689.1 metal-dependent hydrolase [Candidatus Woesearchaeota archaeon]
MPFAVTHVLSSIIAVDLYRDYIAKHRKYFTLHTVFVAGFAGLLPDIDILLGKFLSSFGVEFWHRTFTHTPFFGLLFLVPACILWGMNKKKLAMYFFVTAFGIFMHLLLDFTLSPDLAGGVLLFYPLSYADYGIGILGSLTTLQTMQLYAAMDAIILMLWLWHEEWKHKIRDYL